MGQRHTLSDRSSRLVLSAISGLGLAGTKRRGGAGGIGGCWSPGPCLKNPPGPTETILGRSGVGLGTGWDCTSAFDAEAVWPAEAGLAAGAGLAAAAFGAAFLGAAFAAGFLAAAAFFFFSLAFTGEGRAFRPRRCALPITALRLTPPSSSAI